MLGGSGAYASSLRKFKIFGAVWCVLVYILIDISYRDARGFGEMLPAKILKCLMQSGGF